MTSKTKILAAKLLVVVGVVALLLPGYLKRRQESVDAQKSGQQALVAAATMSGCLDYADLHNGRLPATLEDAKPEIEKTLASLRIPVPFASIENDFAYVGGGKHVREDAEDLALISRHIFAGDRIRARVSGRTSQDPETDAPPP